MFASISRSWEFAKMSYHLLWAHKRLLVFPCISSVAALAVSASFILPLWQTGALAEWAEFMDQQAASQGNAVMWVIVFLFYFCNYFVIAFFNTGLIASVLSIINGNGASVSYGISFAVKRLPQILDWSFVAAFVGVLLKAIEKSNKKAGAIVSAILGSAWTALAYFVVPVIVLDGVGPIKAFKRSAQTLKTTWGTALVGNFSLGFFSFLVMLPVVLLVVVLFGMAVAAESVVVTAFAGAVAVLAIALACAATSAADVVFKAYLYTYATGRSIPEDVDTTAFGDAFRARK